MADQIDMAQERHQLILDSYTHLDVYKFNQQCMPPELRNYD